jgi:hypothetical protein
MVLTHDVDRVYKTYQYLPSILDSLKKLNMHELGYHIYNLCFKHGKKNPYWTFDDICKLENSLNVKSTYYFLNEQGKHNPFSLESWIHYRGVYDIESQCIKEVIKELSNEHFEIGVHGSFDSYNQCEQLESEKNTLESILGIPVKGVRQHYLNYDSQLTPKIHEKTGFKYDTTIGFKPDIGVGFRRGTCFPFQVLLPDMRVSPVLEIPLVIMDGALDSTATVDQCFHLIDQVEKYGGVITILWHTNRFNPKEYPEMTSLYVKIIREAKSRGAWIATAGEVYEWVNNLSEKTDPKGVTI